MFLDQKSVDEFVRKRSELAPRIAEIEQAYRHDAKAKEKKVSELLGSIPYSPAPWTAAVDHIERILEIAGPGAAGLGTDFDGIEDPPAGLEDVSKLPLLTEELLRRGHSEEAIRGVLGENFLRFWERVETARRSAPPREEPLPFSKPDRRKAVGVRR
jgi:membrane dipeptidase